MKVSIVYAIVFSLIITMLLITTKEAYGHGLGGDMAPPVDFQGRNVSIETTLTPMDLALFNIEEGLKPLITVRFFDANSNETIPQVTMRVTIEKDNKLLLNGWFYDPSGEIKFEVRPTNMEGFQIYGEEELQLGAIYNRAGPIRVDAPIFTEGGLYKVSAEVRSAFSTKQLVDPPLRFETWVSVAEDNNFKVNIAGNEYPIVVRTYYDTISKLEYMEEDNSLMFEMPFNWDDRYIELVPMIHEEVIFPKDIAFASTGLFEGYVNGIKMENRIIVVDPYTFPDKLIVHYVIDMFTLKDIKSKMSEQTDKMVFKLVPVINPSGSALQSIQLMADNNKVKNIAQLPKDGIFPQQDSEIRLTFFTANTNSLLRDVRYNIKFFDSDGNLLLDSTRYTPEGIDVITHRFNEEGMVTMQVNIIGVGFSIQRIDTSVAGVAEASISVVPEFPIAILIISIAMISAIIIARKNSLINL